MRPGFAEPDAVGTREALRVLGRAFRYARPFAGRLLAKQALLLASLIPLLVLPWPVKIIVDHALLGVPVGDTPIPYPAPLRSLVGLLEGMGPVEIVLWTAGAQLLLVLLVGAVGTGGAERDQADAYLASGHDQASRTENAANAGFSMASGLLGLFDFRFTIRLTQALNHHYRARLFGRIQTLPFAAFDDERIGDAVFRVMVDTPSITEGVYRILLTPVASAIFGLLVVGLLQALFGSHPVIVGSAVAFLAISFLATFPFAALLRRRSLASRAAGSTTLSTMEEGLSNILAVQSLGAEARERSRFDRDSWASFSRHRGVVLAAMAAFLAALVPGVAVAAVVFHEVAGLVIAGRISVGDFGLLFTYFVMLAFACVEVGALWIRVQEAAVGLRRVFLLMDAPSEEDPPDAVPVPPLREAVSFEEVEVTFPDGTRALDGVSLRLARGRVTALVGPAGAGKTTLASLVPRFHEPSRGRVRFDGFDTARATRDSVRAQVAFVFQETALFDASVLENLRLGRPEASEAEAREALRQAGALAFVEALPDGLHTRLGRGGGKLSVGQRQRLAIARGLLRDAPVLILDEPTSALDSETERGLVQALHEAARDRVVLVIAHRLSTVRHADEIVFLDAGRVVERGTHEALMALEDGAYRRFVELQAREAA